MSAEGFETQKMLGWIAEQTALGARRAGTAGGRAQENFLLQTLKQLGVQNLTTQAIDVSAWEPGPSILEINKVSIDCFPIPYCAFGDVSAELVYAHDRKITNWSGKIVVTEIRFPELDADRLQKIALGVVDKKNTLRGVRHPATWIRLGWHHYAIACRSGAAGFIGILRDQPGGSCRMYAPYGFREKSILDKPLPGIWISREHASFLLEAAKKGTRARLQTSGNKYSAITHNIIGDIPVPSSHRDSDAEMVILSCHHDSPFRSPVEDATGVSVILSLAEQLVKNPLRRHTRILFTAGHFYGSVGTRRFIRSLSMKERERIALVLSIEHIAKEAAEDEKGRLVASGHSEAAGVFLSFNRFLKNSILEAARMSEVDRWLLLPADGPLGNYPPTDSGDWFLEGVPIVNYISNPTYLLTDDDSDNWVDSQSLSRVAHAFYRFLVKSDTFSLKDLRRKHWPLKRVWMKCLRLFVQALKKE